MSLKVEICKDVLQFGKPGEPENQSQRAFVLDWASPFCAYVGGMGSGKSYAGSRKLVWQHIYNAIDNLGRPTGSKSLVVSSSYQVGETVNKPQLIEAFNQFGLEYEWVGKPTKLGFRLPQLCGGDDCESFICRSRTRDHRL
jgi:hypothetical protein